MRLIIFFPFLFVAISCFIYIHWIESKTEFILVDECPKCSHPKIGSEQVDEKECPNCFMKEPFMKELTYPIHSFLSSFLDSRKELYGNHPCHQIKTLGIAEWIHECAQGHEFVWLASGGSSYYQAIIQYFDMTAHFGYKENVFLICIDLRCKYLCDRYTFPCYYPDIEGVNHMAFINGLKLIELPKLLKLGVNVLFIDLDVSFTDDPMKVFLPLSDSSWDVQFQDDVGPNGVNIGLMFIKANSKTVQLFEDAYTIREFYNRTIIDQMGVQKILDLNQTGVKYTRDGIHLKNLLKVFWKDWELGGPDSDNFFGDVPIAFHSTCYEKGMKNLILQATGAWWTNNYCDPRIETVTFEHLEFIEVQKTIDEVNSLILLTKMLGRTLKFPHLLVNGTRVPFFRAVSAESLTNAEFPYVENGYHYRCQKRTGKAPTQQFIQVDKNENFYDLFSRIQKKVIEEGPIQELQILGKLPILENAKMLLPFAVQFCTTLIKDQMTTRQTCLRYCQF